MAARTAAYLFGIPGPTEADLMRVCRALFHFSFLANPNETRVTERARRAAEELRGWMIDEIERRRRDGIQIDDVLGRLLDLKEESGAPLDGETVRRILVGLLVGAIDTTAPTVPRIVYVLASDPALLARVRRDVDDPMKMTGWCWEALRMWSPAPVVFRRTPAPVDTRRPRDTGGLQGGGVHAGGDVRSAASFRSRAVRSARGRCSTT